MSHRLKIPLPQPDQVRASCEIHDLACRLESMIERSCPSNYAKDQALNKLYESVAWARLSVNLKEY